MAPKRSNSRATGGVPRSSPTSPLSPDTNVDAHLIEPVPLKLRKFHPGKGAILVRQVEELLPTQAANGREPTFMQTVSTSLSQEDAGASGTIAAQTRILALGAKGIYISKPDGTVLRVVVYDDVAKLSVFQKYLRLEFSQTGAEHGQPPLTMCLSPFSDNSRNNPRDITDSILRHCRKDVVVEAPPMPTNELDFAAPITSPAVATNSSLFPSASSFALATSMSMGTINTVEDLTRPIAERGAWRPFVEQLYRQLDLHDKVSTVPKLLETFHGKETQLVMGVLKKYRVQDVAGTLRAAMALTVAQEEDRADAPAPIMTHQQDPPQPSPSFTAAPDPVVQRALTPLSRGSLVAPDTDVVTPEGKLSDPSDEAQHFERALMAASMATDDFCEPVIGADDDLRVDGSGDRAIPLPAWNSADNDVNMQWDARHIAERVAEEESIIRASSAGAAPLDYDSDDNPQPMQSGQLAAEDDVPIYTFPTYDENDASRTELQSFQEITQHPPSVDAPLIPDAEPAVATTPVPSQPYEALPVIHPWSQYLVADDGLARLHARARIHIPTMERAQLQGNMVAPAFEELDAMPPSAQLVNHAVYQPYEVAPHSSSLQTDAMLLRHRALDALSTPVRRDMLTPHSRRVFGGGGDPHARGEGDYTVVPISGAVSPSRSRSPSLHFFLPSAADNSGIDTAPAWDVEDEIVIRRPSSPLPSTTHKTSSVASKQSSRALTPTNIPDTIVPTYLRLSTVHPPVTDPSLESHHHFLSDADAGNTTHDMEDASPGSVVHNPPLFTAGKAVWDAMSLKPTTPHRTQAHNVVAAASPWNRSTGMATKLPTAAWNAIDDDEVQAPTSDVGGSTMRRYFWSANATEAMQLLRPVNAEMPMSLSVTDPIHVEVLIRTGARMLQTTTPQHTQQVYAQWDHVTQLRCFKVLQELLEDEFSCTTFLRALAPLVNHRFDSIVVTVQAQPSTAHPAGSLPARPYQVHCPRLLFDAFVVEWDRRSRFVLRASSRHGNVTIDNVALSFLEYLDKYCGRTQLSDGEGPLYSSSSVRSSLSPNVPLHGFIRKSMMRSDVQLRDHHHSPSQAKDEGPMYSSLWARGNVLVRVERIPYHVSSAKQLQQPRDDIDAITLGTSSLPLSDWNDVVSRWNALHE